VNISAHQLTLEKTGSLIFRGKKPAHFSTATGFRAFTIDY